ncbi:MAG: GH25 family lysozyme [Pseudomonadota bacterium]
MKRSDGQHLLAFYCETVLSRFGTVLLRLAFAVILCAIWVQSASSGDFVRPWKEQDEALVLDAYERNAINWSEVVTDKKIRAFIGKSSDGLPPPYKCKQSSEAKKTLCRKTFQNYWLKRELYQTRKTAAKNMGLKWGAYHLGRPGNPIEQANHFLKFADPQPDELIALDIEHDDPEKWISFADAEIFARHIKERLGRYPVLYTNHDTAKRIARQRNKYPLLSRLSLWYARYKEDIRGVFPLGNWERYALWQFSSHLNCNKRKCLYRVKGTRTDIDVNATGLTIAQFEKQWPFGELANSKPLSAKEKNVVIAKKPAKKSVPGSITRYAVSYTIKLGKKKKFKLTSIAIPTPRKRNDFVNKIDPMIVGSIRSISREFSSLRHVSLYPYREIRPDHNHPKARYSMVRIFSPKTYPVATYPHRNSLPLNQMENASGTVEIDIGTNLADNEKAFGTMTYMPLLKSQAMNAIHRNLVENELHKMQGANIGQGDQFNR